MEIDLGELNETYKIEKEIGRGGMGAVYLATDKRLDRKVAIKVLQLTSGNENSDVSEEEVIKRFQREAKAVARLNHTNIVGIHDIGEVNGSHYMVIEFVEGSDLSNLISQTKDDFKMTLNVIAQICNALSFAHKNGIIHRDIKPANIIVSNQGIAKLMDFGIASLNTSNEESFKLTQAGSILGSIMYLSPEQLNNASNVDGRADIYSLGVTLYECITGTLPFKGDTISKIVMQILTEYPEPASKYNPNIPKEIDEIIKKAMTKDAAQRYQSIDEMGKELAEFLNDPILSANFSNQTNKITINENITKENKLSFEEFKSTVVLGDKNSINNEGLNKESTMIIDQNQFRTMLAGNSIKETSIAKTILGRTTINNPIIDSYEKDFSWLEILMEDWKSDDLSDEDFEDVLKKLTSRKDLEENFSGVLILDEIIYAFIYDGYFVGAVNIVLRTFGEEVFITLQDTFERIELKTPPDNSKYFSLVISSILDHESPFSVSLDSSNVNLLPLVENFASGNEPFTGCVKCYTQSNIYYFGFSLGSQIFSCSANVNDESIPLEISNDLKKIIQLDNIVMNTYKINPKIIGPSIKNLLQATTIKIKYKKDTKAKLKDIIELGSEEIPNYLKKELKGNIKLAISLKKDSSIRFIDKELDLKSFIENSEYYLFCDWLINEYLYEINSSQNTNSLKLLYLSISEISEFKFLQNIEGSDGRNYNYDIIPISNSKRNLSIIKFGDGDSLGITNFINEAKIIKKKYSKSNELGSILYVSEKEFTESAINIFNEKTTEPKKSFLLNAFDSSSKYKGFVRIGSGKGFHVNLIKSFKKDNCYKVISPNLFEN